MSICTAIFDMDGLLIDSEPLWYEAAVEVFAPFGITLSPASYASSIGLRTKEFVAWWLNQFQIDPQHAMPVEKLINEVVIDKISRKGEAMDGAFYALELLKTNGYTIGLATSSPSKLIDVVVDKLNIRNYFSAFASAEHLVYGKPHPQVYIDCAIAMNCSPADCICFEDSFHGMIAAKAARMKCIVIPALVMKDELRWHAADLQLGSLAELTAEMLEEISN